MYDLTCRLISRSKERTQVKNQAFWYVTPYRLVNSSHTFASQHVMTCQKTNLRRHQRENVKSRTSMDFGTFRNSMREGEREKVRGGWDNLHSEKLIYTLHEILSE